MFVKSNKYLSTFIFSVLCAMLFFPGAIHAMAILKEDVQQSGPVAEATSKLSPQVLGIYQDYTAVKKKNSRYALARSTKMLKRFLSARSAIIIDARSGQTLYARNPDKPRQPASTIKVLTAMIALKSLDGSEDVPISRKAARQPSSKLWLSQNEKYPVDDLIDAVLLGSANDASVALAEKIAGSEKSFAQLMTIRAKLWGAPKTVCKNSTGLTARGQRSTSRDLAIIFKHAMEDPEFAERMKQTRTRTSFGRLVHNHNKALWRVQGAEGGKTGYTNAARQTYVGKFKRGKNEIIIAIMGSETMWRDVNHLVEYGFSKKQVIAEEKMPDNVQIAALDF